MTLDESESCNALMGFKTACMIFLFILFCCNFPVKGESYKGTCITGFGGMRDKINFTYQITRSSQRPIHGGTEVSYQFFSETQKLQLMIDSIGAQSDTIAYRVTRENTVLSSSVSLR